MGEAGSAVAIGVASYDCSPPLSIPVLVEDGPAATPSPVKRSRIHVGPPEKEPGTSTEDGIPVAASSPSGRCRLPASGGDKLCPRTPPAGFSSQTLRQSWTGDIGFALFSPLDGIMRRTERDGAHGEGDGRVPPGRSTSPTVLSPSNGTASFHENSDDSDDDDYSSDKCGNYGHADHRCAREVEADEPVAVAEEDAAVLESSPRLLTNAMMRQLCDRGLPASQQIARWHRAYSLSRDGDCFQTMVEGCAPFRHTVVVIRTTGEELLGGYADTPWGRGKRNFFGSGRAFVFATNPDLPKENGSGLDCWQGWGSSFRGTISPHSVTNATAEGGKDQVEGASAENESIYVFRWTGDNTYSQICSIGEGKLAMGGGGSFGFMVQENFTRGTTGPCSTFGNPRLTGDSGGCFQVLDLEVYGLKSSLFPMAM